MSSVNDLIVYLSCFPIMNVLSAGWLRMYLSKETGSIPRKVAACLRFKRYG